MASIVVTLMDISTISGGARREVPAKPFLKTNTRTRTSSNCLCDKEKVGVRVGNRSDAKEMKYRVSELAMTSWISRQFSAPVKESSSAAKQSKEDEEKQNCHVNTGYAIRALREEFPHLFYKELSFDIYRDDIVFRDPMNTFVGIENYKSIFWALRFHGRIFFKALWLDIISVWQPAQGTIMVRWTVHGIPRGPWESHGRFDGTSEYKLDKNGKIFEHRVDNIAVNSPPKFQVLSVEELIQSIGCPSSARPTYFEFLPSPFINSTHSW